MAARTKARKRALDILFESDQRGSNVGEVLAERRRESGAQTALPEYSATIVEGVLERWADIDERLTNASHEWSLARMPAVDRALLRIGAWEILYAEDVPRAVAIAEAIELAGQLSTDDSGRFINGVLASIDAETTKDDGAPVE